MTIKSDDSVSSSIFSAKDNSLLAWWKYSGTEHKILTAFSFGIGWDFRNSVKRPEKRYKQKIDEKLKLFEDNIDDLELDSYKLVFEDDSFWIANKYYGWAFNSSKYKEIGLTVRQIARLDNLIMRVEKKMIEAL